MVAVFFGGSGEAAHNSPNQVELSPADKFGLSFTYYRNNREYPNRPNRVPVVSGVPAAILATFSGG